MSAEKKYILRLSAISLLLFMISLLAVAQPSNDAYRIENFDVSGDVSLEVQTSGGSISVIGSSESEVKVEMFVRRRGNYIAPGKADLSKYDIDISQSGNNINAIVKKTGNNSWNWNDDYSISFVVYAPNSTRSRLRTSGGSVAVRNLKGTQELKTSGGTITAEGIYGEMDLRTSGGSIRITDAQGNVNARTSGGTIRGTSIAGDIDVRTSGGSIRLESIEGEIKARTSGGTIRAEVLAPSKQINLRTSGGSIRIRVPEGGYNLDLDGSRVNVDLVNFTGKAERGEVEGTINGGGPEIYARTSGGSVSLDFMK